LGDIPCGSESGEAEGRDEGTGEEGNREGCTEAEAISRCKGEARGESGEGESGEKSEGNQRWDGAVLMQVIS
jgi:hypothetical protein